MRWLFGLFAALLAIYLVLLLALVVWQRRLMYFPGGPDGPAADYNLPNTQTLQLTTADGENIVAWYRPAAAGKPLFLYFHGNGGTLAIRADFLRELAADGSGVLAIDYRGYGRSTGAPSEPGLLLDGDAAYAEARTLGYDPARIVVIGESLGSGVAVALAASHPVGALVLDSAFSSTVDVAAAQYPFFPVRLLMRDTYDSASRIGRVRAPKLFLHGVQDPIIPIAMARKLFAAAAEPKTFIALPDAGHIVLWAPTVLARTRAWLAESLPK